MGCGWRAVVWEYYPDFGLGRHNGRAGHQAAGSGARCPWPGHPPGITQDRRRTMAKKLLMLVGDYVEDYEVMVPF